jgi:hypothetical protein
MKKKNKKKARRTKEGYKLTLVNKVIKALKGPFIKIPLDDIEFAKWLKSKRK